MKWDWDGIRIGNGIGDGIGDGIGNGVGIGYGIGTDGGIWTELGIGIEVGIGIRNGVRTKIKILGHSAPTKHFTKRPEWLTPGFKDGLAFSAPFLAYPEIRTLGNHRRARIRSDAQNLSSLQILVHAV